MANDMQAAPMTVTLTPDPAPSAPAGTAGAQGFKSDALTSGPQDESQSNGQHHHGHHGGHNGCHDGGQGDCHGSGHDGGHQATTETFNIVNNGSGNEFVDVNEIFSMMSKHQGHEVINITDNGSGNITADINLLFEYMKGDSYFKNHMQDVTINAINRGSGNEYINVNEHGDGAVLHVNETNTGTGSIYSNVNKYQEFMAHVTGGDHQAPPDAPHPAFLPELHAAHTDMSMLHA